MQIKEKPTELLNSNNNETRLDNGLPEDRYYKANNPYSVFTFANAKRQDTRFFEDEKNAKEQLNNQYNKIKEDSAPKLKNTGNKYFRKEASCLAEVKQQTDITFKNLSTKSSEEINSSCDVDKLINACIKKYTNKREKRAEFNSSHLSSDLESINITKFCDNTFSNSEDDYLEDISLDKRSIMLFNKDSESLVTVSDGESNHHGSDKKKRKKALFNFVEL